MRFRPIFFALFALLAAALPATASAARVPEGADWSQATIPSSDGVKLHADILRPKGLAPTDKTPVILSIGPYFNHSGQTGPAGPAEGTSYDPVGPSTGPVGSLPRLRRGREADGARLHVRDGRPARLRRLDRLPRLGRARASSPTSSTPCKWAASQPWSTGKVGMYGKSYDGVTGLIGVNHQPGRARRRSSPRSRSTTSTATSTATASGATNSVADAGAVRPDRRDARPGADDPNYNVDGLDDTQRPGCPVLNLADQAANDDHYSAYWRQRNLIPGAKGSTVPLFLTQGLTENNTVADGTAQYLENHAGYERAWLGPWEHVRGNETDENGRLKMGRAGWFDEVMRFYDRFLKGDDADRPGPADRRADQRRQVARRAELAARRRARATRAPLRAGTYTDDGSGNATGDDADGVWTISPPLPHAAHLSGSGKAIVDVATTRPNANLVVDVYDLDEYGIGPLITRQGFLARSSGEKTLDLWSADWKLPAGHRIGVRVDRRQRGLVGRTRRCSTTVKVVGGSVTLPFLTYTRTEHDPGRPGHPARGLPERDDHGAARDDAGLGRPVLQPSAGPAAGANHHGRGQLR